MPVASYQYFSQTELAIGQSNAADPLAFTPATGAICPAKPGDLTNAGPDSDRLNFGDLAQNPETHPEIVVLMDLPVKVVL
jgi:hypothetical protein